MNTKMWNWTIITCVRKIIRQKITFWLSSCIIKKTLKQITHKNSSFFHNTNSKLSIIITCIFIFHYFHFHDDDDDDDDANRNRNRNYSHRALLLTIQFHKHDEQTDQERITTNSYDAPPPSHHSTSLNSFSRSAHNCCCPFKFFTDIYIASNLKQK